MGSRFARGTWVVRLMAFTGTGLVLALAGCSTAAPSALRPLRPRPPPAQGPRSRCTRLAERAVARSTCRAACASAAGRSWGQLHDHRPRRRNGVARGGHRSSRARLQRGLAATETAPR